MIARARYFTLQEKASIKECYALNKNIKNGGWLTQLSKKLNRQKTSISRYARKVNLTSFNRTANGTSKYKIFICIECKSNFSYLKYQNKVFCSKTCNNKYRSPIQSTKFKRWHQTHEHPRGMLGKKQSNENIAKMIVRTKRLWADKNSTFNSISFRKRQSETMRKIILERLRNKPASIYSRTIKGWREFPDGRKYYFRSKWEMNYAYYLEFLKKNKQIKEWKYEEKTFWFEKIRRGIRSYTPDFEVTTNTETIEYHEVKGWFDNKSKTKLNRMRIYYPTVKITLIDESYYKTLKKQVSKLCNWE